MSLLIGASSGLQGAAGASAGGGADLGDTIDQSLRFRGGQVLSRTFSGSSNRDKCTFSVWVKRSDPGNADNIFGAASGATNFERLIFNPTPNLSVYSQSGGSDYINVRTSALYRDPAAWYHLVYVKDTTQATSTDRIKLYINGARVTDLEATTFPAQNSTSGQINNSVQHTLGRDPDTGVDFLDGYLAEAYFLDDIAIGETSGVIDEFGKYNTDSVWVPQNYTGSYGTNGFHLTFDSTQANGIGHDSSGNGNNFTASGFQTTSSHENYDLDYNDTPTSNYSTLNALRTTTPVGRVPFDASLTIDGGSDSGNWQAISGTCAQNSGKRFFETEVSSSGSNAQNQFIGFASSDCRFGIASLQDNATERAKGMILLCNDGNSQLDGNSRLSYSSAPGAGEVIGALIDFDDDEVEFFRNGTSLGTIDISSSPLANGQMILPVNIVIGGGNNSHDMYLNYGQRAFQHAPSGVTAADNGFETNIMPEPTIKNGKEHFESILWDGDGNDDRNITTTEGFAPDFVWIKRRTNDDGAGNHGLFDTVRGATIRLMSNFANAEDTQANDLQAFRSDGFQIGTQARVNDSGQNYVAWCWKAGGTAVSNTDGTITSSVSANTDAGFSIVSYTGTGTNGATIGHGLNSAPDVIFIKTRGISGNWVVYHSAVGATHALQLDGGGAASDDNTFFNDTEPTSSVFTLGTHGRVNTNTRTQIAYCWHSVEGFSKFGSYVGNGNTDGPFVYTGFKVSWLLVRQSDVSGGNTVSWTIIDAERDTSNPAQISLKPNSNATESDSSSFATDFLSNGFKVRNSADNNTSGKTIIYMAFGSNPFGGENAPPVTAF